MNNKMSIVCYWIPKSWAFRLTVILPVQIVHQSLYARLVEVSDVTRRLSGFLARHDGGWGNGTEGVDNDFPSNGLNRVDDDSHCSRIELLERLRGRDHDELDNYRLKSLRHRPVEC
jgi:hypothetical protein